MAVSQMDPGKLPSVDALRAAELIDIVTYVSKNVVWPKKGVVQGE